MEFFNGMRQFLEENKDDVIEIKNYVEFREALIGVVDFGDKIFLTEARPFKGGIALLKKYNSIDELKEDIKSLMFIYKHKKDSLEEIIENKYKNELEGDSIIKVIYDNNDNMYKLPDELK